MPFSPIHALGKRKERVKLTLFITDEEMQAAVERDTAFGFDMTLSDVERDVPVLMPVLNEYGREGMNILVVQFTDMGAVSLAIQLIDTFGTGSPASKSAMKRALGMTTHLFQLEMERTEGQWHVLSAVGLK